MKRSLFSFTILLNLFFANHLSATLPAKVDGQALPSLAPMLEKANPAVVNISTTEIVDSRFRREFFGMFEAPLSLGSGVIIDAKKGLILTNHHVIQGADAIKVSLEDGREFDAKLLGSDKETDVAVIQIEADKLSALPTGNSDSLRVGDFVVAIGNPFSLGHSVTSGIVSAKGRQGLGIKRYEDFIQTDAAINPGNSGGALVNLHGELIGVNTAILGPSGGNVGIGFAIPIKLALNVMEQLLKYGEVRRGLLGIRGEDLTPRIAKALDLTTSKGVIVTRITEDSAADKAGILQYDVITHLNGKRIRSNSELMNQLGLLSTDKKVELTLIRGDKELELTTSLDELRYKAFAGEKAHWLLSGVTIGESSNLEEDLSHLKIMKIDDNSFAFASGLRKGDKIIAFDRYRIVNFNQLVRLAARMRRGLPLVIERNDESRVLIIQR